MSSCIISNFSFDTSLVYKGALIYFELSRLCVAFFDVEVINPNSTSYLQYSTKKTLENAERQKARRYNERILNVQHGSFAPLIYSVTGGVGPQAKIFEKLLCNKLAYKKGQIYSVIIKAPRNSPIYPHKRSFTPPRIFVLNKIWISSLS